MENIERRKNKYIIAIAVAASLTGSCEQQKVSIDPPKVGERYYMPLDPYARSLTVENESISNKNNTFSKGEQCYASELGTGEIMDIDEKNKIARVFYHYPMWRLHYYEMLKGDTHYGPGGSACPEGVIYTADYNLNDINSGPNFREKERQIFDPYSGKLSR